MQTALRDAIGERNLDIIDATGIAAALMGDSIATNMFMLGFAFQKGAIPLSLEALAARDRDQRRRDRDEQAGLHLGPAGRARHVARVAACCSSRPAPATAGDQTLDEMIAAAPNS